MTFAIKIENLAKRFRINHAEANRRGGYRTLRDSLAQAVSTTWQNIRGGAALGDVEDFWALRDVSFEVQPGDVVGVIGRNGAGKSTLLKILTRVTEPTLGSAMIRGRVGSLLEVGTGFHPELTGRENVFLNGSILGMARSEINRNYDQIVEFSGVEKFIDTPIKRYSSGMKVRLAFAIAAHLDLEVMLVDEVLAVGDVDFQRKCLQRLRDVTRSGRTVLFVSHNMPAIESLCDRAVLLANGKVDAIGDVDEILNRYHQQNRVQDGPDRCIRTLTNRPGSGNILKQVVLLDPSGAATDHLLLGREFRLRMVLEPNRVIHNPVIFIGIDDPLGQRVLSINTPLTDSWVQTLVDRTEVECRIPDFPVAPGEYWLKIALGTNHETIDAVDQALLFRVENAEMFDEGRGFHRGSCVARSRWSVVG
ncbi:MAG: ABC transporter ATP-binding protein [Planctomycetes bacterium]|nr:ABC transporter ATP-binding protein [Planctomycetota bacterium]